MTMDDTSTGRDWPATTTVLLVGGLGEGASDREGETTCTTGDSLVGGGEGPGETLVTGDILAAGDILGFVTTTELPTDEGALTTTTAVGLMGPPAVPTGMVDILFMLTLLETFLKVPATDVTGILVVLGISL